MDEKGIWQLLTEILYASLNETEAASTVAERLTPEALAPVCRLARKHDLLHVVAAFVQNHKIRADAKLSEGLRRALMTSVYRCQQMKHAFAEICDALDGAGIPHIPLKGSVIRPYYPYESMRTSCDIDILIHREDLEGAVKVLTDKGYRCEKEQFHDVSLYSPGGIHLELHFHLKEGVNSMDAVLKDAWDYAVPTTGSRYGFRESFFVFHMYAHMAYHFVSGGCGIRSLMDIWVMEQKMGLSHTCAKELLTRAGLYDFARGMSRVANRCFTENVTDDFTELALKYIYAGGVYGSKENTVAVKKSQNKSSFVYVLRRMFLPYRTMVFGYPILKKAPFLLPFCWVVRWVRAIFGKSKKISHEINCVNNMSEQRIDEVKEICRQLGL